MNTSDHWIVGDLSPNYTIRYKYHWWGGVRYISATVYLKGWGLLFFCKRTTAKAAYKAAQRAVRAYDRHSSINYSGPKTKGRAA